MNRGVSRERQESNFIRYMKRTYKNKLCAIALIIFGLVATSVLRELSGMLFVSMLAIPLFFARDNWIVD